MMLNHIFNTRELAILIWIAVSFVFFILHPQTRSSVTGLLKSIFVKDILIVYGLAATYILICVWILSSLGLPEKLLMKDVIWWYFFVASITLFKLNQIAENKKYFRSSVKDNFKFTFLLDFLAGFYTFNLWVELLLIPLAVLVGVMLAFTESGVKYSQVRKVSNSLLSFFGLILLIYALLQLIRNFGDFASFSTLSSFLLPPLLSILFLPFLYLMSLYMIYEAGFVNIRFALKSPELISFAKIQALIRFNFDTEGFNRWRFSLFRKDITSKEDIIHSIDTIKELQEIEKSPPTVPYERGWSPYLAKDFLFKNGISTGFYGNPVDDEWQASSNYVKINNAIIEDTIAFYAVGNRSTVTSLKLSMNIYYPENSSRSHVIFLHHVKTLYLNAMLSSSPMELENAVVKGKPYKNFYNGIDVVSKKELWKNTNDGYSIDFEITRKSTRIINSPKLP